VLFQVAEGSADPDLGQEDISWSVLCDNYWKPLETSEVALDTTNQLLTSGVITFVIPSEATTDNTILPADQIWIKAAVAENVTAVCQLIDVAANAVEAQFDDRGNDPAHLQTSLEAGTITNSRTAFRRQECLSALFVVWGQSEEADDAFYARAASGSGTRTGALPGGTMSASFWKDSPRFIKSNASRMQGRDRGLRPGMY